MSFVLSQARLQEESIQKHLGSSYSLPDIWPTSDNETQNNKIRNTLRDGSPGKLRDIRAFMNPRVFDAILATIKTSNSSFGKIVSVIF
jgi:hypothetical protein